MAQHLSSEKNPGLSARLLAAQALHDAIFRRRSLDQIFDRNTGLTELKSLEERDRALVRMLVTIVLRRLGTLRVLLGQLLERGLPKDAPHVEIALLLGAAQILFLSVPDHAAVDLSVELVNKDPAASRYSGLVNAVLRRIAREGKARIEKFEPGLDTPAWMLARWIEAYGRDTALAIAEAHGLEPALDITVKDDAGAWASTLAGHVMPTGSVRIAGAGPVVELEGYGDGAWWVQDAAAILPAKLLGDVSGKTVADLCAAPGGKTAQLANAGAKAVAVDRSKPRLKRLKENLARLKFTAEIVEADATDWQHPPFDAVLLDAPCTATGTIRRHPELPWQREPADLARLVALQARLLDNAMKLLPPGGILVYATCSLEPEECERQIEDFLRRHSCMRRVPVRADEVGGVESFVMANGDFRAFPFHLPNQDKRLSGCDGFYAARLQRLS